MIIDRLENVALYRGLGKRLAQALDVLKMNELPWLDAGRHELDGTKLFAIVQHGSTKPKEQALWEAHRKYIDVQYIVEGAEMMGCTRLAPELPVREAYDEGKDIVFFDSTPGEGNFFRADAGTFVIFFPHDVHMPSLAVHAPEAVRKVVVKVAVEG
jgi:YhcH/YjgK/YiaL family protein